MFRLELKFDMTGFKRFRGNAIQEVCVALGIAKHNIWRPIPSSADFMSTAPGAIGNLHLNVLKNECNFLSYGKTVRRIEPYIFLAASLSNVVLYWKQLAKLERLERYADSNHRGTALVGGSSGDRSKDDT